MAEELELTETTRDEVGGVAVGVGNILDDDEYELPDGGTGHGLTARLHTEDGGRLVVGRGSVFELGDGRWEVLDVISGGDEDFGTVTLRRVE
jgi:hypothetical protein